MDLERIKQNLRIRSGRTKKLRKAPKPPPPPPTQNSQHTQTDLETPPPASNEHKAVGVDAEDDSVAPRQDTPPRQSLDRHDSGTGLSGSGVRSTSPKQDKTPDSEPEQKPEQEQAHTHNQGQEQQKMGHAADPPRRRPLSRRSTARSDTSTGSQKHTSQLLSSLMAVDSASNSDQSSDEDYDLRPPAPKPKPPSAETTAELLFSAGHLNTLLYHPPLLTRFTSFIHRYSPEDYPILVRYLETSKAIAAVEYANAVVDSAPLLPHEQGESKSAASLDEAFQSSYNASFQSLLHNALPLYITYSLVRIVSECLENEITGKTTPMMRALVGGLSEVFCLTDPKQPDNPIIYASEEFYRYTGFGRDDVIGHNCRFLQGPKTKRQSPRRLKMCLDKGEEVCETLLNYRRDGRPFINLLMIAPLHDDKGDVKYHIGAQVDVSGLAEDGRAIESFRRHLERRKSTQQRDEREAVRYANDAEAQKKQKTLAKLRDLSELFDLEESAVVVSHSRSNSTDREEDVRSTGSRQKTSRKILTTSDVSDDDDDAVAVDDPSAWELGAAGPRGLSGKLPGVYEKYMLIRPAPSLRTIFVSPKLQSYGKLVQSPFLSHVAAPPSTLTGLADSFNSGTPVSARINFMPKRGAERGGTKLRPGTRHEDGKYGRACWISATPLLDSEDKVGVWMIVFVERLKGRDRPDRYQSQLRGVFGRTLSEKEELTLSKRQARQYERAKKQDLPIKPVRIDSSGQSQPFPSYRHVPARAIDEQSSNGDVFEDVPGPSYQPYVVTPQPASRQNSRDHVSTTSHRQDSHDRVSTTSSRRRFGQDSDDEDAADNQNKKNIGSPIPSYLPADLPPSEPSDAQSPEHTPLDNKTTTRPKHKENSPARSRSNSRVESAGRSPARQSPARQSPARPSSGQKSASPTPKPKSGRLQPAKAPPKYMDYLSHPGSNRHISSEFSDRGRSKAKERWDEADGVTDLDCIRSPYSID